MLFIMLLMVTTAEAVGIQTTCAVGKAVSLSLSHHTNGSGHTILNGRLQQQPEAAWYLDVGLQTSACGAVHTHSKVITFSLTGSSAKARVPPGYVLREGFGYFRGATHALNWTAARDACAREGAHLAFANSQEEALMLTRDFKFDIPGSPIKTIAWYGASDLAEEGKFVTVTDVPLDNTGFANFHPRSLDGNTNENCIYIIKENQFLEDGGCPTPLAYICKVSL